MIRIRKSSDRGLADLGWLNSRHTFSFSSYQDPAHMGWSVLRVINEDRIEGGAGFETHGHRDMEILSYVIDGALEHRDSMGTQTLIRPGEVQRMSAGTGVEHSEYNHLKEEKTHFLQIWIQPNQLGIQPSYSQKSFETDFHSNDWVLVCSQSGRNGSITLHQDVDVYVAKTQNAGQRIYKTAIERHLWIQVIRGEVEADEVQLHAGDGAGLQRVESLNLKWRAGSEFLLFDLP